MTKTTKLLVGAAKLIELPIQSLERYAGIGGCNDRVPWWIHTSVEKILMI